MYAVGAILSATGLYTIAFILESPRVAALMLLRLYKPRDSSNIGFAQIRIFGSLALRSSSAPAGSLTNPSQSQSSLSWLSIVHHCLTVADKDPQGSSSSLLNSLRTTAGRQYMSVEQCCTLFNAPGSASASKAGYDVIQMAWDVLLDLSRPPVVSNVLHELCVYEDVSCSPDGVMDAEPDEPREDPSGSGNSGQSLLLEWFHQTVLWPSGSDLCGKEALAGEHSVHFAAAVLLPMDFAQYFYYFKMYLHLFTNQLLKCFHRALFYWTKIITTPELKVAIDYALCFVGRHRSDSLGWDQSAPLPALLSLRRSVMETLARACQSESALQEQVSSATHGKY